MSFRKRNLGLAGSRTPGSSASTSSILQASDLRRETAPQIPGVRPSPLDGRGTTSTGTHSLDGLLAGHAGLALGNSILLEESGTTDYAGTLLRFYAAEGVAQGHAVHVVGVGEYWGRDLPGLAGAADNDKETKKITTGDQERMKIAWRYEGLGEFGAGTSRAPPLPVRTPLIDSSTLQEAPAQVFCHSFDLTKRLTLPSPSAINFLQIRPSSSPFRSIIDSLKQSLSTTPSSTVNRLLIPSLLSPAFYPSVCSSPRNILQFFHSLRSLLRQYPARLTVMISLPLALYPRESGMTRWMEWLSDGVIELIPFPHSVDTGLSLAASGAATAQEEKPLGMFKLHRLPVFHERGGGSATGAGVGDDLAFTVSRKRFTIKPFSLPPLEGDTEAQKGTPDGKATKIDIEF